VASEEAIYLYSSADAITLRSGDNIGGLFSGAVFTKKATDVSGLKYLDTKNLANVGGLYGPYLADDMSDLSHWDLTGVTSWGGGFNSYFTQAQMAVVENWKVPNNVSLSGMMSGNSNITNLEFLKNWDTTQVANHNNEFVGMPGLKSTKGAGELVGSAATNLSNMFAGDSNLASLESLDKWDVSNVTTMAAMFPSTKLNDLSPLRNWNVSSVEEFNSMFASISALTDIGPLANWNVSSATNLSGMFASTYITDVCSLAGWDVSSVTDFSNMFYKTKISDASCLNGWQVDSSANLSMMFKDTQITDESKYPSWYTADRRGN
jgi:surface protein